MGEQAGRLGATAGADELLVQSHLGEVRRAEVVRPHLFGIERVQQHPFLQQRDAPRPLGLVLRLRDQRAAGGEEFFLLQLDALPRRIAEHHGESARPHPRLLSRERARGENVREFQPPVKDLIGSANARGFGKRLGIRSLALGQAP